MGPVYKPEYYEFLYEKSSRNRILVTAKTLFASLGYDNTSTAVIARNAGTSESQLMKHFGGKAGLLETIFTEGWNKINAQLEECFKTANSLSEKLSCIPTVALSNLDQDLEIKTLVLLEAHRMREVARTAPLESGYGRFLALIDREIERSVAQNEFKRPVPAWPLRSALVGMVEGCIRDQVLGARANFPANYTSEDCRTLFSRFIDTVVSGAPARHFGAQLTT